MAAVQLTYTIVYNYLYLTNIPSVVVNVMSIVIDECHDLGFSVVTKC